MHSHPTEAAFMADIEEGAPEMAPASFGFDKAVSGKNTGKPGPRHT